MSTTYYKLAPPISSLRVEESGQHVRVTVFCNGANCGTLLFQKNEAQEFLALFRGEEAYLSYFGGVDRGCIVERLVDEPLSPETSLISESGKLVTVAEVLDMAGSDGPTAAQANEILGKRHYS